MSPNPTSMRTWSLFAALMLVTTGLAGCVDDAQASSGEVYVKDALTDEVDAVHVEYTSAEILPAEADETAHDAWETVYEGNQSVDLLSLSDSAAKEQLADFEIEPGEYDRLRLRISNVTVEHPNGTQEKLVVHGNVLTVAENLSFEPGEDKKVLLDFDLESGVNVTRGEFVPVVGDVQRSDEDADDDGRPDFVETDDDNDGTPDAEDEDRNGDGQPDLPTQAQGYDKRGLKGLCTAWENNEQGRENGTVEDNATAFGWLQDNAAEAGQSVDAYCEEQTKPGAPNDVAHVASENLPEQAREAIGDRNLGPPEDRGPGAGEDRRGDDGNQTADERRDNRTRDGNQTSEERSGNQTADRDGNQTRDDQQANRSTGGQDGNQTDDGNRSADGQP